ncbi:universal stress protein [Salinibacterium sp. SWN139]|uniref:universal stress protein n=1 Tax=Salinibacterium sp. SWN139 TaxID=2792055 RepID=UPI0018CE309A|nr:universal stress protein [Salinibacterium sp. SWN139]MBH0054419.1 universal stress protein [Salinibacterium sp. SWN139]
MADTRDFNRIMVGVDGSHSSVEALRAGAKIATALNAPLRAVMTWQVLPMTNIFPLEGWSPEDDAKQALSAAIEEAFDGSPPPNLTASTICGAPAPALIEESKRASMLILGRRGLGGFTGLLLGSVSAACVSHAHCPVLIMHGDERKS